MIKYGDQISLVMISMNEEQAVAKVIEDIQKTDKRIEIVIVDSSSDKTAEIAKKMGARVFVQLPPIGYSPAMDLALKSATRDILITMDCDDTYPVTMIDKFSRIIADENYDVVDGSRLYKKPQFMPLINYLANIFFGLIASLLFFKYLLDLHSGMRAYRKDIIHNMPYNNQGVSLPVELILWPIRMKKKVKIISINYTERLGQSKLEPLKAAWWTVLRILWARFKSY